MFDPILEFAAQILNFFYSLVPSYVISIILMTLLVLAITSPLTLKGTRGMIKLQLLQPELKRIQSQYKDDRQKMNEEMMRFYQENEVNPLGGCLPLLVQAPIFLLLYNVIRGLTRRGADGTFDPRYLSPDSELYRALHMNEDMMSFGIDLSRSTTDALGSSIITGLPYLGLILAMIGAQYYQQRQISARNPDGSSAAMPQQQIIMKVMPVFFGVISINFPAALVIYWTTSNVARIGLQAYITRSLYHGEDSLGQQAAVATKEARSLGKPGDDAGNNGKAKARPDSAKSAAKAEPKPKPIPEGPLQSKRVTPSKKTPAPGPQPSSKKKKRKRR